MTNKEKQAKLQYLLNSLSMTKEQKDIVVDLVNSSGNGGGNDETLVIKVYRKTHDDDTITHVIEVEDYVYDTGDTSYFITIGDKQLFNILDDAIKKNKKLIVQSDIQLNMNIEFLTISVARVTNGLFIDASIDETASVVLFVSDGPINN